MDIIIEKLQSSDAKKLYEFEYDNRVYFEKMVPGRGDDYYIIETFENNHEALLNEQDQGLSYFYLIKNLAEDLILGRINLIDIDVTKRLGHVGYRIGEAYTGKGVACKALKIFLEIISKQGIEEISAKTTTNNIASQKVLEKNGFKQTGSDNEEFIMNGETLSLCIIVGLILKLVLYHLNGDEPNLMHFVKQAKKKNALTNKKIR